VQQRPIAAADEPPRLWLDASTATICRYALDRPRTESDGELGSGFPVDVARSRERELFAGAAGHPARGAWPDLGPALDDTVGATHRTSNAER
jgi:NAD dependent epimerase/dehydratase family enzyme